MVINSFAIVWIDIPFSILSVDLTSIITAFAEQASSIVDLCGAALH